MAGSRPGIFRFFEELENNYNQARFGTAPRELRENDILDWSAAQESRRPTLESKRQIQKAIAQYNPVRWARLQGEMRWMRKTMVKLGLNPEDAGMYL